MKYIKSYNEANLQNDLFDEVYDCILGMFNDNLDKVLEDLQEEINTFKDDPDWTGPEIFHNFIVHLVKPYYKDFGKYFINNYIYSKHEDKKSDLHNYLYLKFKESDKRIAELINQLCEFE